MLEARVWCDYSRGFEMCVHIKNHNQLARLENGVVVWDEFERFKVVEREPFLRLPPGILDAIVDAALKEGIKPKESSFTEGKLEATEKHLKDLQKLVFRRVK